MSLANGNYFIFNDKRYAGRMLAEPLLFGPLPVVLHDPSIKPQKVGIELIYFRPVLVAHRIDL